MARHPLRSPPRRKTKPRVGRRIALALGLTLLLGIGLWYGWSVYRPRAPLILNSPAPVTPVPVTPSVPAPTERSSPPPPPTVSTPSPVTVVPEPTTNVTTTPTPAPVQPPPVPLTPPTDLTTAPGRVATNILEAQIALTSYGISSGPIDGIGGAQTAAALRAFQFEQGLEQTGRLDPDTQADLKLTRPLFRTYTVRAEDLSALVTIPDTWLGKADLSRLGYQTALEEIAEQSHANPSLLRRLNPKVNWNALTAGEEIVVPNAEYPPARRAALVRISLAGRYLRAFDARGGLLAHFPCSIGRIAEKRPVGQLTVVVTVKDPNYTFDPAVFPESEEAKQIGRKLIIPPGPNNPVGVAWIGLSRPGFGIHGTPIPEQVGRTESHGCFRLANWNAEYLRQMVSPGTPVWVEP